MTRWLRRTFRRCGLDVPFTGVVCPEEVKTISIDPQWRATTTVRRQMVFLERPVEGDLRDIVPVASGAGGDSRILASPDGTDIGRRPLGTGTCVYWKPREPIIEYAVYTHERSWSTPAHDVKEVLCTELVCRSKVATLGIEIVAPASYETAVAFKLPRWHRLATERRLMTYALAQIDSSQSRPIISDARMRVSWKVSRPRIGERFVCIAFTASGLAAWQQVLEKTSIRGRLRRLLRIRGRERGTTTTSPGRVLLPGR